MSSSGMSVLAEIHRPARMLVTAVAVLGIALLAPQRSKPRAPPPAVLEPGFTCIELAEPAPPIAMPVSTHGACTEPDFDGDGTIDRVEEEPDSCGTGGCVYRAYVGERFLGTIEGQCSFTLERSHRELADVITTWRLGADETVVTRYRFDGRRYREVGR